MGAGISDDITLVVPARGRHGLTKKLLDSLWEAAAPFPIILVDDATPEPLADAIPDYPGLRLSIVRNDTNMGPAASRNVGVARSRTRFVAFTDNDVTVTPTWMARLYEHMLHAPPEVAGVGGTVLDDGSSLIGRYATRLGLLDPYVHMGRTIYLVTANCLLRRDAFLRIGGFNESFRSPGGEDPELSFRLLQVGYRLDHEPSAVVVHHYGRSWPGFYRLFRRYGRGCRRAMGTLARDARA